MGFDYPRNVCFACNRCGLCCGDTPTRDRRILLLPAEAQRISELTSTAIDAFAEPIRDAEPYVYRMRKIQGKCLFLKDSQCTIYPDRPLICRFYPLTIRSNWRRRYIFGYTSECPKTSEGTQGALDRSFYEELYKTFRENMKQNKKN